MPPSRPPLAQTALTATAIASVLLPMPLQASPDAASPDELTGGATTVWADGKNAFSFPAANLSDEERTCFVIGNSFFKPNRVQAPASTKVRDGLGPHFIARSCGGCHVLDGRGAPPEPGAHCRHAQPTEMLVRLSIPGTPNPQDGMLPEPTYGDQFNNAAVEGVRPDGTVRLGCTPVKGRFADGTPYAPQKTAHQLDRPGLRPDGCRCDDQRPRGTAVERAGTLAKGLPAMVAQFLRLSLHALRHQAQVLAGGCRHGCGAVGLLSQRFARFWPAPVRFLPTARHPWLPLHQQQFQGLLGVRDAATLEKRAEWMTNGLEHHFVLALPAI